MDEAKGLYLHVAGVAEPSNRASSTLPKQTTLVRYQYRHLFFLDMFYTHKHPNSAVTSIIIRFKCYLCCIGRARNASDADIPVFRNYFLFTDILI